MPASPKWTLFPRFPHQNSYKLLPIRSTCPAHSILLNLVTLTIFCEQYRPLTLCSFLHAPVSTSHISRNTFLSTIFSNTPSLRSSPNMSDQSNRENYNSGFLNVKIFIANLKTKYSAPNDSKHCLNSICP